jgi:hypothetical protein
MTSILKLSETNEAKDTAASSEPLKKPIDPAGEWESLRGLTTTLHQKQPSTRWRTALLTVLLIVGFASLGLLLHNHMPALVTLGQELSETVDRLTSPTPAPSTAARAPELPDLRHGHSKRRSYHASVPDSPLEQVYDPAFHPFYATTVIGGRRVSLHSSNSIVVLHMGDGTWNFASETE